MEWREFIKKNWLYWLVLLGIIVLFFIIRFHNVRVYNTWWADDGGGHIQYEQTILDFHRLPTPAESYLAWHEPGFYILLSFWVKLGAIFGFSSVDYWASLNILINLFFLLVIWLISYYYLELKNKWLSLLQIFVFSVLFVSIKLSAYVNNELLNQTLILLLVWLFYFWRLLEPQKTRRLILWSILLGVALTIKLTSFVVLLSALIIWLAEMIIRKKKYFLKYILICLVIVATINFPWLCYKYQHWGQTFSINLYETLPKQGLITSHAWRYLFNFNYHFVTDNPYWYSLPHSFWTVLISDTFGDYYNLFNNVDKINSLPDNLKILVSNGRFTTLQLWQTLLGTNRIGLGVSIIWFVGLAGWLSEWFKQKKYRDNYKNFLLLVLVGGWLALLYNNLRLPYLERGVLKAHFIYYTFPVLTLLAYTWWFKFIKNKYLLFLVAAAPFLLYLIFGWPLLFMIK